MAPLCIARAVILFAIANASANPHTKIEARAPKALWLQKSKERERERVKTILQVYNIWKVNIHETN